MSTSERQFPVLRNWRKDMKSWRTTVPWRLLAPHEAQAKATHDQTLVRLAERGGLSPVEMLGVVEGWNPWSRNAADLPTDEAAMAKLDALIEALP